MNRMRTQRGLPAADSAGGWQAGDYRGYLPDFSNVEPDVKGPGRLHYLKNLLIWSGVLAASVMLVRAMV
jgi:hypothetical protein